MRVEDTFGFPNPDVFHELAPGVTTLWPPGSVGYANEKAIVEFMIANRQTGYGRMAQIAQALMAQAMAERFPPVEPKGKQ